MTAMTELTNFVSDNFTLDVDIQSALEHETGSSDTEEPPSPDVLTRWAQLAYAHVNQSNNSLAELTIRLVGNNEMRELNSQYRSQDKTTNVLSFPLENEFPELGDIDLCLLGDIIICHDVVVIEAIQQSKTVNDHYAHMVVHGVLHLLGYDHHGDQEAEQMEALEVTILTQDNIANPYKNAN